MGCGENDGEVDWWENVILHDVGVFDEEVSAKAVLVPGRDEVVEFDEALLESFGWVGVETSEEDGENGGEVLLNCGAKT